MAMIRLVKERFSRQLIAGLAFPTHMCVFVLGPPPLRLDLMLLAIRPLVCIGDIMRTQAQYELVATCHQIPRDRDFRQ